MRFVPPHDQALAAAFKAAAITFLTAWLIPGKRACKAGTNERAKLGQARRGEAVLSSEMCDGLIEGAQGLDQ
jgi:hypothetical protein